MATFKQILGAIAGKTGKAIDTVSRATGSYSPFIKTPEFHISENLQRIGGMLNPVKTANAQVLGTTDTSGSYYPNSVNGYGNTTLFASNQNTGGGTTGGTSGGSTGTYDLSSLLGGSQDLGLTGAAYDQARQDIEAQNPLLDQSYNLAKGDIEGSVAQTEAGAAKQKEANKLTYGNILKSISQTYNELGRKATGTFAGLNTLDSSAYGENMLRLNQGQGEQTATTQRDEQGAANTIDENVRAFKSKATSELAQLGIQYQQGKNAISSALANNDIQGASAIKSMIDQIRTRAVSLASLLQGEGGGVNNLISATNGNLFGQNMGKSLANLTAEGAKTYTVPTTDYSGSGFVSPDGRKFKNYLEYLSSMGA